MTGTPNGDDTLKHRLLITGATGFIGSHVLETLAKEEKYEIGITLRSASNMWRIQSILNDNMKRFYLDKDSMISVISTFKPDIVVHLAVYYRKDHDYNDIDEMVRTNIAFPIKLLEAMEKNGVEYFINTGTLSEYLLEETTLNSKSALSPTNLYAATKIAFEDILKFYNERYGIKAITLKLLFPYGPKDEVKKLIPHLLQCALKGEVAYASQGNQLLDYVYVKDVASAYKSAIEFIPKSHRNYDVFIIGSGEPHSPREVADIIRSFGFKLKVNWGGHRSDQEIFYAKADITKARNLLQWWPKYSLREGLIETLGYYKSVIGNE